MNHLSLTLSLFFICGCVTHGPASPVASATKSDLPTHLTDDVSRVSREAVGEWYYARKEYILGSTHAYLWNSATGELLEDNGGSSGPSNEDKFGGPLDSRPGDVTWKNPDPKTGIAHRDARALRNADGSKLTKVQEEKMRAFMLQWRVYNFLWVPYVRDCHDAVDQAIKLVGLPKPGGTDRFDSIAQ